MSGIHNWVVIGTGYTQDLGRDNGLTAMWRRLRPFANDDTCLLTPRAWNADWSDLAAFIKANSDIDARACGHVRVFGCFYSYGGGVAFPKFAKALDNHAIRIEHAVLVDPVPRFGPARPWAKVKVHSNVSNVTHFYQRQTRPKGHDLKLRWPAYTKVVRREELPYPHVGIDDAHEVHAAFTQIVQEIASP